MKYQAHPIILAAGSGSRMTSLVKRHPKCLLPICNYPMIFYTLYMLKNAGFTETTVIVSIKSESDIRKAIDQLNLDIKAEFIAIDISSDPGTADTLRLIGDKIKKTVEDVIIISSDIVSNVSVEEMMTQHMAVGSMLTMLTSKVDKFKMLVPGPKVKSIQDEDILLIGTDVANVKYSISAGEYEDCLSFGILNQLGFNSPLELFTSVDSHLYILKRCVLDYILNKNSPCSSMISIKSEVIPHIIESQNVNKTNPLESYLNNGEKEEILSMYNTSSKCGYYNATNPDKKICQTFFHGNCYRANKLATYWMMNTKLIDSFEDFIASDIERRHFTANIHERAQVCPKSFVGKKAIISEKTNVKSSAIGNQCKIEPLVRISNSVLFDQITIGSGVVIEDSIVCVSIDINCTLKKCVVIDASTLISNHAYENEVIESSHDFS